MCPIVGTLVERSFTHGMAALSNMPLFAVCSPVASTDSDGVDMIAAA